MVAPIWISGIFILSVTHTNVLMLGILFNLPGHISSFVRGGNNSIHFSGVDAGIK